MIELKDRDKEDKSIKRGESCILPRFLNISHKS